MRLIIAGSRDFTDYNLLKLMINSLNLKPSLVLCGMARGADLLGARWASENSVPVAEFPADWDAYGKSAGYKRNQEMAAFADALIAFWDGKSKGTKHMLDIAESRGLKVYMVPI
jgi:YspA, cpYpsA-related SLOG family